MSGLWGLCEGGSLIILISEMLFKNIKLFLQNYDSKLKTVINAFPKTTNKHLYGRLVTD